MQRINPTRINLINSRKRIAMARKGHSILKRKREVLVIEFLRMLRQSKNDRVYLNAILKSAYKSAAIAVAYVGNFELEEVALHVKEVDPVRIEIKNIMGVRIPIITKPQEPPEVRLESFKMISTSVAAEDISNSFSDVRDAVVDISQREQGLRRLVLEIEKTKRRVNALEYIIIPGITAQSKYISMRLDEIDRDMFAALKHVKKKLAKAS
jgi:V/A-type H+-transporting ATPase subunit D